MRYSCVKALLIVSIIILSCDIIFAQGLTYWLSAKGPGGGHINDFLLQKDTLWASGSGGVFRRENAAEGWQYNGLGDQRVYALSKNSRYLYAVTEEGAFRTRLSVINWQKIYNQSCYAVLAMDTVVILGTRYTAMRSVDDGLTWQEANQGLERGRFDFLFMTSQQTVLAVIYGQSSDLFRSTDDGQTWAKVDPHPFGWNVADIYEYNQTLYGIRQENYAQIYKSKDDGISWSKPMNARAPDDVLLSICADKTGVYVGSIRDGVYKSVDFGRSWRNMSDGLYNRSITELDVQNDTLFASSYDGISISGNQAHSWHEYNDNLSNSSIRDIAADGHVLYAASWGGGVFKRTNAENHWQRLDIGVNRPYVNCIETTAKTIVISAGHAGYYYSGKPLVSDDQGATWQRTDSYYMAINDLRAHENWVFAAGKSGLSRSDDYGYSWRKVLFSNNMHSVAIGDPVVLALQGRNRLYRSLNMGGIWYEIEMPDDYGLDILRNVGGKFYAGARYGRKLYRSDDDGESWQVISLPASYGTISDIIGYGSSIVVSVSDHGRILKSMDAGQTWTDISRSIYTSDIYCLEYNGKQLFCGTQNAGIMHLSSVDTPYVIKHPKHRAEKQNINIDFAWQSVPGISRYWFQLAEDKNFHNMVTENQTVIGNTYTVRGLQYAQQYYWRICPAMDNWGRDFSTPYQFRTQNPPIKLHQNFPNPFESCTTFLFDVPVSGRVRIVLYDILGRKVETILDRWYAAGPDYTYLYSQNHLASGIYLSCLISGGQRSTRKLIVLK
ncbi:MAG: T9SS type A sorting domain-containing protein [Caldithrix sp.]|nr:T9SS type A sorting domain-containing protein [Caldithrix sp.]